MSTPRIRCGSTEPRGGWIIVRGVSDDRQPLMAPTLRAGTTRFRQLSGAIPENMRSSQAFLRLTRC
jgi:hypothetical protein